MKNVVIAVLAIALASVLALDARADPRGGGSEAGPHGLLRAQGPLEGVTREVHRLVREVPFQARGDGLLLGRHPAEDVDEPVSVKDFDVALHVVFASKEAKAKYLESTRHHQFVDENGPVFGKVRVFDSYLVND